MRIVSSPSFPDLVSVTFSCPDPEVERKIKSAKSRTMPMLGAISKALDGLGGIARLARPGRLRGNRCEQPLRLLAADQLQNPYAPDAPKLLRVDDAQAGIELDD